MSLGQQYVSIRYTKTAAKWDDAVKGVANKARSWGRGGSPTTATPNIKPEFTAGPAAQGPQSILRRSVKPAAVAAGGIGSTVAGKALYDTATDKAEDGAYQAVTDKIDSTIGAVTEPISDAWEGAKDYGSQALNWVGDNKALAAGGVGSAALLYYLLSQDDEEEEKKSGRGRPPGSGRGRGRPRKVV